MAFNFKSWSDRFFGRRTALPTLDLLVAAAPVTESLENRLNWLVDVVQWIRRPGYAEEPPVAVEIQLQTGRMRRLFDVLDRQPEWKRAVAKTLRSIIRETSALELFSETGLPRQFGLFAEAGERLTRKFLPPPPGSAELGVLFERLFPYRQDGNWIEKLDDATLERFWGLLQFEVTEAESGWNTLAEELQDSLLHLAAQLQVNGCSGAIRERVPHHSIRDIPFAKFTGVCHAALVAAKKGDPEALTAELNYLHALVDGSHKTIVDVMSHLEKRGVSTSVVYQVAFIEASLERFETLLDLTFNPALPRIQIAAFVAALVRSNLARESLVDLVRTNSRLLTRKIVERNAETGEHYITRTPGEFADTLRRAAGGGAIMAVTTWIKTILLRWHLPGLLEGLAASGNYASGFVAIQLTGSILATKQPANTAPALAARMHKVREPAALEELIDEIVYLIRSQFAAVVGNLALVVPTMLLLHWVILAVRHAPILSAEEAPRAIAALSILGPSIIYAGFTGILLWASSLIGAGADNWFACNQVGEALAGDRRLIRFFGPSRTLRAARFFQRNIAGLGSNISFGLMLGLIPELAHFAGIPLDIRHVTLSSSMLTAAVASLGLDVIYQWPFWLAVMGVLAIGLVNVTVSFSLAMLVAIRARDIRGPERQVMYLALLKRFVRYPFSFFLPLAHKTRIVIAAPDVTLPA